MVSKLKEEWMNDPSLSHWKNKSCTHGNNSCRCGSDENHVELWEHDSCIRGRIDTTICRVCKSIINFKIIR